MDATVKLLREHLKKSNITEGGLCFKRLKKDNEDFVICVDEDGKVMIFMEDDDKKYTMSFSNNENKFFFQLGIGVVTIYHGSFNKNKISRSIYAANTFKFNEETLYRLPDFWVDKREVLEEVSFYVIRGMLLALEYIIKDLQLELSDFGFTNFD